MKKWFDKVRGFWREVKEEVLKCARPSFQELKESTVIVVTTMVILGCFISIADFSISQIFNVFLVG